MSGWLSRFAMVVVLACAVFPATVWGEETDLFVLAGQSNMQGWQGDGEHYPDDANGIDKQIRFYWVTPQFSSSQGRWTCMRPQGGLFPKGHFGPEVTFSRLLVGAGYHPAIFKVSLGSTSLALVWKAPGENGMYDQMVSELENAVALLHRQGHRVSFRALVWIQGESDAESEELAAGYENRLRVLIDHFRRVVAKEERLPIILGLDEQHWWVKAIPKVLEAQQQIAEGDPQIIFTSMVGLEKADATHLTPRGLEEHGARLFAAYEQLTSSRHQSNGAGSPP